MNFDNWYLSYADPKGLKEFEREMKSHSIEDFLEKYYPISALVTIFVAFISCLLHLILIYWERFGMDPMKRGIKNRVSLIDTHFVT